MDIRLIVSRLNDALRHDWKGISALICTRVPASPALADVFSLVALNGQQAGIGPLGLLNGLLRENADGPQIEACVEEGEIVMFKLAGEEAEVVDVRSINVQEMVAHQSYRVTDLTGNHWIGTFLGFRGSDQQQGVHLQMSDGSISRIFFPDVKKVVNF